MVDNDKLEIKYSSFVKNLFLIVPLGYLLAIILPTYKSKNYQLVDPTTGTPVDDPTVKLEFELDSEEFLFAFDGSLEIGGFLGIFFLLISILFSGLIILKVRKNENIGRRRHIPWIMALTAFFFYDAFREFLVRQAYDDRVVFDNILPYSFGIYTLIISIFLNIILLKIPPESSWDDLKVGFRDRLSRLRGYLWGPTTVMVLTLHFTTLIFMMISYGRWAGYGKILEAPTYYTRLMFNYGLNRNLEIPFYVQGLSWIVAPMVVVILGTGLFLLKSGGFAPNGPGIRETAPEASYFDPDIPNNRFSIWGYYSRDVPGITEDNFLGSSPKFNEFYLFVVWGSIICAMIIGSLINYYLFGRRKQVRFFVFLRFFAVASWFIGWGVASMSAPVFVFPSAIITSVLFNRGENRFVRYKWQSVDQPDNGFYHPLGVFWYLFFIWILISILYTITNIALSNLLRGEWRVKKESEAISGKYHDESQSELPFIKEAKS